MTQVQVIPGNFHITDPEWPVYDIRRTITSDDFSGTGELVGSLTSAALGGVPMTWQGETDGWTRHNGGILSPSTSYVNRLVLPSMPNDLYVGVRIKQLPSAGRFILSLRYNETDNDRVILWVTYRGGVALRQQVKGVETGTSELAGAVRLGDIVGIEARGDKLRVLVNGRVKLEWSTQVVAGGSVALSTWPVNNSAVDDLVVAEV